MLEIVKEVGAIEGLNKISITSNGIVLWRMLEQLQSAGLNGVNISLDTLRPERFVEITRRQGFDRVLKSIDKALELGFDPVKINCVVMRGMNEDEIEDFAEMTRDKPIDVRFIEYMPFDGNQWNDKKLFSYQELLDKLALRFGPLDRLDDAPNETAKGKCFFLFFFLPITL